MTHCLKNLCAIVRATVEMDALYLVPDGGLGLIYSSLYVFLARRKCRRVFLHHRTYDYILHSKFLMRCLLGVAGSDAVHIFLDATMACRFDVTYCRTTAKRILGNAVTCDVAPVTETGGESREVACRNVSYLSNLSIDKGFDTVASVFRRLKSDSTAKIRFMIAGAPMGTLEQAILDDLIRDMGASMTYWGAVSGLTKQKFFEATDIFLFPTRFRQEAQPNVIYEALAAGCYVISTNRACIPAMLKDIPSTVVQENSQIIETLVQAISGAMLQYRPEQRIVIQEKFRRIQSGSIAEYHALLREISGILPAKNSSAA